MCIYHNKKQTLRAYKPSKKPDFKEAIIKINLFILLDSLISTVISFKMETSIPDTNLQDSVLIFSLK